MNLPLLKENMIVGISAAERLGHDDGVRSPSSSVAPSLLRLGSLSDHELLWLEEPHGFPA
jgi:hypothetical protein